MDLKNRSRSGMFRKCSGNPALTAEDVPGGAEIPLKELECACFEDYQYMLGMNQAAKH
ncbi:hypothetical protein [Victivallis vadensis]|uniref:hypothetical protein n=1 Tax=Victivallis vadensis TaxID=172901 RepID=UPI00307D6312